MSSFRPRRTASGLALAAALAFILPSAPGAAALEAQQPPRGEPSADADASPEEERLRTLLPESTSTHQRINVRTRTQPDGYPALDAEYGGPGGLVQVHVIFEDPEGGRAAAMLEEARDEAVVEPFDLGDLEAYRVFRAAESEGMNGVEQRLVRVPGPEKDAWVLAMGFEGRDEILRELVEAMDAGRLAGWMDEWEDGPEAQQEAPPGSEVEALVSFVPERTSTHERSDVRAGTDPSAFPAVEVEFEGPGGMIHFSVVFQDDEGGRVARMLRGALERGDGEPWEFGGVEAYRLSLPARGPGQSEMEQRLLRIEAPGKDAWIMVAGPEGRAEPMVELLEALDLERLAGWMEGLEERLDAGG